MNQFRDVLGTQQNTMCSLHLPDQMDSFFETKSQSKNPLRTPLTLGLLANHCVAADERRSVIYVVFFPSPATNPLTQWD